MDTSDALVAAGASSERATAGVPMSDNPAVRASAATRAAKGLGLERTEASSPDWTAAGAVEGMAYTWERSQTPRS
ncbi:hypothetical protein GCM10020227_00570 [Streptomyces flavovirens]